MKTRVITAVVGLAVLAVVLAFFDTIVFDFVLSAICLLAIWRHAPNIRRLMNHTESKINLGKGKKAV